MSYNLLPSHKIFLKKMDEPAWNLCSYCFFDNANSFSHLEVAMNKVIEKNDALRMKITSNKKVIFEPYKYRHFETFTFNSKKEFLLWASTKANESIINCSGMWNAFLIKINNKIGVLNIGHHIICDSMNVYILYKKIKTELTQGEDIFYSYKSHLLQYNDYLKSNKLDYDKKYWDFKITDVFNFKKTNVSFAKAKNITIKLPSIDSISKKYKVSEAAILYAATSIFLMRIRSLNDITLGIPVIGRTNIQELESLGLFMHNLPLYIKYKNISFMKFALLFQNELYDLFRHQNYELPNIPLFDVSIDYSKYVDIDGCDFDVLYNNHISTSLEFHFLKKDKLSLTIRAKENEFLYLKEIKQAFKTLINSIIKNPTSKINDFKIADLPVSNTDVIIPNCSLFELIENKNRGYIIENDITYKISDLIKCAELIDAQISKNKRVVAIICERSFLQLVAIYGVIRGGNAYLPISPDLPTNRINYMLKTANCDTVLVQEKYKNIFKQGLIIEHLLANNKVIIPPVKATSQDTLYVIFTSGSTGKPKGVMISNKSAINRIQWMCNKYFDESSIIMLKTPYTFDVSVWEIFGFALSKSSLYILPPNDHYNYNKVIEHINKGRVSDIHFVPTVYSQFLKILKESQESLPTLKNVFLSGETLYSSLVNKSSFKVHNLYGPTECSVDVTYYDCKIKEKDPVPIGYPIDNCSIYILDNHLRPLPKGVIGQICISGIPVGKGYINNINKTNESFINDNFFKGKIYLTGDYGYFNIKNQLVYISRKDSQIKINGQRIELSEIEISLNKIVDSCSVVFVDNKIVAFYTGNENKHLKEKLSKRLPKFMIPQIFIHVDKLPLTINGKIDKSKLLQTKFQHYDYEKPLTQLEKYVCKLFSRILNIQNVGRNDDFFNLGGTSFQLTELMSQKKLNNLNVSDIIANPTPAKIAFLLTKDTKSSSISLLYKAKNEMSVIVLFPFAGGTEIAYSSLVNEFKIRSSTTSLYFVPRNSNLEKVAQSLQNINVPIRFYSHCAGVAIGMQLLNVFNNVDEFIIGANIPPENTQNIWKNLDDSKIVEILKAAGLTRKYNDSNFLKNFRNNTDEYFSVLAKQKTNTVQKVSLILGTKDPFTMNLHNKAYSNWNKYFANVSEIRYINTNSHYFQSVSSRYLSDILLK